MEKTCCKIRKLQKSENRFSHSEDLSRSGGWAPDSKSTWFLVVFSLLNDVFFDTPKPNLLNPKQHLMGVVSKLAAFFSSKAVQVGPSNMALWQMKSPWHPALAWYRLMVRFFVD